MENRDSIKDYTDYAVGLFPFREFDSKVFIGDDDYPEELCRFILALSLVYNDVKFIQININILNKCLDRKNEKKVIGEIGVLAVIKKGPIPIILGPRILTHSSGIP